MTFYVVNREYGNIVNTLEAETREEAEEMIAVFGDEYEIGRPGPKKIRSYRLWNKVVVG